MPYLGPPSHLLRRIKWPLALNALVALFVILDGQMQFLGVATSDFGEDVAQTWRLTTFVLALLLGFRVNRVYQRFSVAQQEYGAVGNAAVMVVQDAAVWVRDAALVGEIARWAAVWQYSLEQLLRGRKSLHANVAHLLNEQEHAYYESAPRPRQVVALQLRRLASLALNRPEALGAFLKINDAIDRGTYAMGACARVYFYAMPYSLTLVSSGFLEIWLLLMPFLATVNGRPAGAGFDWARLVKDLVLYLMSSVMLLGIDEVTNQLEQPFAFLPLVDTAEANRRAVARVTDEVARGAALTDARLGWQGCTFAPGEEQQQGGAAAGGGGGGAAAGAAASAGRVLPIDVRVQNGGA